MKRFLHDNGLTLTMTALFLIFLMGQSATGYRVEIQERQDHEQPPVSYAAYVTSGHSIEATFENWESEFLQMSLYVMLTVFLFQRGSSESKDPDGDDREAETAESMAESNQRPWPVRHGGIVLQVYEHSLTIALALIFLFSFVFHLWGGARAFNENQRAHGAPEMSTLRFLTTAEFWFQSFQNWQSEFLAVAALAFFSIFLRQRSSPESKPVSAPHSQTGA